MDDEAMSPSPRAGAAAYAGIHWEAHGRLLTACLVALNVFLVLLVYVYFWRFFSRSRGGAGEDDVDAEGASSVASSPPASPKARDRREVQLAITALPVFVHSSSPGGGGGGATGGGPAAAECAICIAEFADGDEGRLLPRCGHRFHVRCVDTWFRFHTTCPLCRATVLAEAAPPEEPAQTANLPLHQQIQHHTDTPNSTGADTDSPV
ncbi:unnamed protein product [Miscanthus lutarioriparius]|uniref:RING-type domain-containing protein n=1 Tax=Miscanthus lutarioriparius TaxID=422564 RepID=A0A811RQY0_9POAL|nr:unnamed protein product [Miscanthus lutarioriparius]